MFAFFMGVENGKWKWQCTACKEIFYTETMKAETIPQAHQCAAQQSVQADGLTRQEKMEALESVLKVTGGL